MTGLDKDNAEGKSRKAAKAQRKHARYAVAPHFQINCAPCLSVRGSCAGANLRGGALEEVATTGRTGHGNHLTHMLLDRASVWLQTRGVMLRRAQQERVRFTVR